MNTSSLDTSRIVFLGDSITDGNSYCGLVVQALAGQGKAVHAVNAGIGGDTARGMLGRLERDVFAFSPTLVTFSSGANDAHQGVSLADYAAAVTAIVDQLLARDIDVLLLTTGTLAKSKYEMESTMVEYNAFLRSLAAEQGLALADVHALMAQATDSGLTLIEDDGTHPNRSGHDVIARAVLDGMGYVDLPVTEYVPSILPGVIPAWLMRAADNPDPLSPSDIEAMRHRGQFINVTIPVAYPIKHWWKAHEAKRGFVVDLGNLIPGGRYHGMATVTSHGTRNAWLNTGAGLGAVWLNGAEVYRASGFHGWHAGRDRIAVKLLDGENDFVIETAGDFFVSVTDDRDW